MRTLILLTVLLAGCGQSGDLYLPSEAPAPSPPPTPSPESRDDTRKEPP